MRLGRLATDLFTLKYQTKHFLYCEVSIKQDTEEKHWVSGIRFTGIVQRELDRASVEGNNTEVNCFVYC